MLHVDQYTPILSITSEEYEADNVTATVQWNQEVGISYMSRILPLAPSFFTGSNSQQLILLYNTGYNLSVIAVTPCRTNTTAFIQLSYGEV